MLAVYHPAPSRARILNLIQIRKGTPRQPSRRPQQSTLWPRPRVVASTRCLQSPSMQNPRQAQTRLKPLLTHSRRVNQTLGAGRRWAEVGCRDSARGTEAECIGLRPIDARLDHMPTTCLHCGGRRGWTATWHLSKSGDPHWHQRQCRRLARGSQTLQR